MGNENTIVMNMPLESKYCWVAISLQLPMTARREISRKREAGVLSLLQPTHGRHGIKAGTSPIPHMLCKHDR